MGMKKSDVFELILKGIAVANPAVGRAVAGGAAGIKALIHRDDDPTNDLDETADALTAIALNVVMGTETLTGKDYANDPILAQLAENIKGDLKLAQLVVARKPGPS